MPLFGDNDGGVDFGLALFDRQLASSCRSAVRWSALLSLASLA
jgi:hypothetical protein